MNTHFPRTYDIPLDRIYSVTAQPTFLNQIVLVVDFYDLESGEPDRLVWAVPSPVEWSNDLHKAIVEFKNRAVMHY